MGEILAKVFYTPVQIPEEVRCIEIGEPEDLELINSFVREIVNKKLKAPTTSRPQFREDILTDFMNKNISEIESKNVQNLFEILSQYMYGRAREPKKYWCLITTEEYLFIYHFTPERSVSFEDSNIREFIKYLDDSTLLKFIFRLKSESVPSYFSKLSEEELEQIQEETSEVYGVFDRSGTKGLKKLTGEEPDYEFKGELRVRVRRSDKTDIVIETFLDDLENIKSSVSLDFQRGLATIKIEDGPIIELVVDGVKYDVKTGIKKISYEKLGVGGFIEKYRFYRDKNVSELKEQVIVNSRRIEKPENNFPGKEETIFILGELVQDYDDLIKESSESIKNNLNVAFVELNGFNANYDKHDIGHFTVFARFKEDEKIGAVEETFNKIIGAINGNTTLEKSLHYIGLLVLCEFLKSGGFKEKLYQIGKTALSAHYMSMLAGNIELKEIDKLGIEFKAGIKRIVLDGGERNVGFFEPSPNKFSEKLLKVFRKKRKDTIIFFVGINEDTRDFSPIPLDRIRNEFHERMKEILSQNGVRVLLSETIPITEKDGVLIIVLQKGRKNETS